MSYYDLLKCCACFCISFFIFTQSLQAIPLDQVQDVSYSFIENFRAKLMVPTWNADFAPIVILNYHEDYEKMHTAKLAGYVRDIVETMAVLEQAGAITLVPMRKGISVNALRGAVAYAKRMPYGDKTRIYMMGVSEGALLSALATSYHPELRGLVLVTPRSIHDTGAFSLSELIRRAPKIKVPALSFLGLQFSAHDIRQGELVNEILQQNGIKIKIKLYDEIEKWFFNPENLYMQDIKDFIFNDYYENIEDDENAPETEEKRLEQNLEIG